MPTINRIILLLLFVTLLFPQEFGRIQGPKQDQEKEQTVESFDEQSESVFALEKTIDPETYILGPGDKLGLNVLTRDIQTLSLIVTPTGDLFIPGVGLCHVAGLTLETAINVVKEFVQEEAYPDAQTYIALLQPRRFKLLVSGAVIKPGFVTVTPLSRLDEVIEYVDGFHQLAKEYEIKVVRQNGQENIINYYQYLLNGDLASNPTFLEGDRIIVPFGEIVNNGIVVRGSVTGAGYDIIAPGETLGDYIKRKVIFRKDADLENVTISRKKESKSENLTIGPDKFDSTVLQAGDIISFMWERGVTVTGFVQAPGGFSYFPGYSVSDYIALAGGNTTKGNPKAVSIKHLNGDTEKGMDAFIQRGDVIYVPRTKKDIYFGELSVLQMVTAVANIVLAYMATTP